jgi:hypothetical protein
MTDKPDIDYARKRGWAPQLLIDELPAADKPATTLQSNLTSEQAYALEALIDQAGIELVLMALSEICGAKAEHIASNWQDTLLAKRWATLEGAIGCIVPKATGL